MSRFPHRNAELLKLWLNEMGRVGWSPSKESVLCSKHFRGECFIKYETYTRLKENSVPTLFNKSNKVTYKI